MGARISYIRCPLRLREGQKSHSQSSPRRGYLAAPDAFSPDRGKFIPSLGLHVMVKKSTKVAAKAAKKAKAAHKNEQKHAKKSKSKSKSAAGAGDDYDDDDDDDEDNDLEAVLEKVCYSLVFVVWCGVVC